jgi:hypothetical protein
MGNMSHFSTHVAHFLLFGDTFEAGMNHAIPAQYKWACQSEHPVPFVRELVIIPPLLNQPQIWV